jgi:hypothetical protein
MPTSAALLEKRRREKEAKAMRRKKKHQRRRATTAEDREAHKNFRAGLFDGKVREEYTEYYAKSSPYVMSAFLLGVPY